jgi:glycosyltransferase involved in cell wall biosynthesis
MQLGLLTSWPLRTTLGSGVMTSVRGFTRGLGGLGDVVSLLDEVAPARTATGTLRRRLRYNRGLPRRVRQAPELDALLGFDWDGFRLDPVRRPPLTVFCGGTLADILRFESGWARRLLTAQAGWDRRNLVRADQVAVPSRYAAESVRRWYGERLHPEVVPLAVDAELWAEEPAISPPSTLERPLLLSVARLYRRKGIDLLLRAWDRVRRQLGTGPLVGAADPARGGRGRAGPLPQLAGCGRRTPPAVKIRAPRGRPDVHRPVGPGQSLANWFSMKRWASTMSLSRIRATSLASRS